MDTSSSVRPRLMLTVAVLVAVTAVAILWRPVPADVASEPLRARAGAGGPLFERVAPEESGLRFENVLRPEHSYPYLNNGAGVAIGDVDGDGLPDVYLVSRDGPNRLFRQTAPFRFEDVTQRAGVDGGEAWGAGASFVDIDGDGDLDLYVCNTEAPNLLYVNRGDGTFDERAREHGLDHVGATEMAAFADYDRDGDVDVYLLTNRVFSGTLPREILADVRPPADTRKTVEEMAPPDPDWKRVEGEWHIPEHLRDFFVMVAGRPYYGGQPDRLLRNDGGRFTDVTEEAGFSDQGMGLSATWWDYDGDGWPDLYVANDLESPDQLYRNNGDGTFADVSQRALPRIAYFGMGADAADIDNDGRLDLIVADMSSTTHFMAKRLMGDMDRRRDVLEQSRPQQQMRNALFVGTGTDRFLEVAHLAGVSSTDWTWAVKLGDLDNDGRVDLYVTNGIPRFDMNPDIALGLRGAPPQVVARVARQIPPLPEENLALRNAGDLQFERVSEAWGLNHRGVSQGAAFADLDRDGDLDLVVNNLNEPAWLYRNRGDAGRAVLIRLRGTRSNRLGLGARVSLRTAAGEQMRELTLSRGYLSSDEPLLHFGLGSAERIDELRVRWPSGARQTLTDLAVDRLYTITEPRTAPPPEPRAEARERWLADHGAASGLRFQHRERAFDDYAVQPLLPHKLSQLGPGIAWGDADGDGDEDVYVGGAAGQSGMLYENTGEGHFRPRDGPWGADAEAEDMGALWLDADGDSDLDLYVVSGGVEGDAGGPVFADRLYLNHGRGVFARAPAGTLPDLRDSGSVVAGADFDRDGDLDLFVGGRVVPGRFPYGAGGRLLRNDGGRFTDVTEALAPGLLGTDMVTAALWSDADGDGWPDLLVAAHWQPVVLYRNRGEAGGFADGAPLGPERGWWNGLCGADLDGDGDLDYVATNTGLDTKYHADPEHPTSIYARDFDGDGVLDVVEAKYERDVQLPVRGRSCSSNAMPFIAEKFPTYELFARADLQAIYSRPALDQALHLQATELRSGVFHNRGDGTFAFAPLSRRAQVAPGFGAAAVDLDGDGWCDVVLAHNFYSPEPETGRMAGGLGLFLRGGPGGALAPVPPAESGLVVPQDAKALAVCDLDGDERPDLVITTNNGPLRVFQNRAPPGRHLVVHLRGRAGNPAAVGARVTLRTERGGAQVTEVHAGSGYLSQSTGQLFFGLGGQQPREVVVRWPDGTTTRRPVEPGARRIEVAW